MSSMRDGPVTLRLKTGADGLLMSYSTTCGELPRVSLLLSAGNDPSARLLPSTRTRRARQFTSFAGFETGNVLTAVPNGILPMTVGPATRLFPSVTFRVNVSPGDAGIEAGKLPAAANVTPGGGPPGGALRSRGERAPPG